MTRAEEIRIQDVSPESTLGGADPSANAALAIQEPMNSSESRNFFISFLLLNYWKEQKSIPTE
jgi:hypothetical protein